MPKIIVINRYCMPDESATSRMVSSLAVALVQRKFQPVLLASRALHNIRTEALPPFEVISGVAVHRLSTSRFGRSSLVGRALDYLSFHAAVFLWLLRNIHAEDVCIVCTDPPLASATAILPITLRQGIMVNWIMDLFPEAAIALGVVRGRGLLTRALLWFRDLSLKHARLNIAPIPRMADALRKRGVPASRIRVIEHWSDGEAIRPLPNDGTPLRREWGLERYFVVGYSGNLGRAHDFRTVLQAAQLLKNDPTIAFLFIGGGHHRLWLEREAERLGLRNVLFKPLQPREHLAEALAVADVHLVTLLPALEEYIIPSKFHGIAAAGRPVLFVGDQNGEVAGLIRAGRCGASVTIGDHEGLSAWIMRLRDNASMREEFGRNARRLFERRFTEARGVADWTRLLGDILRDNGAEVQGAELTAVGEPGGKR